VVFVTHSIEEAIYLSDRIVVMTARPGRSSRSVVVPEARPRDMASVDMNQRQREVRAVLSEEIARAAALEGGRPDGGAESWRMCLIRECRRGACRRGSGSQIARRWMPRRERWLGIATIVAFIAIWESSIGSADAEMGFPSPGNGLGLSGAYPNGKLLTNTAASVGRQITVCFSPRVVGIPAGLALGASPTARAAFLALRLLYPIPGLPGFRFDPVVRRGFTSTVS